MKQFVKTYWKTLLFFGIIGLVGGFFVGLYALESYPAEIQQQLIAEVEKVGINGIPVEILLGIVTAVQSLGYGVILGGVGIYLAKKIGLWKDEKSIEKQPLIAALIIAIVGGFMLILPDIFWFGKQSQAIMDTYEAKPTISYLIATVTYGAVIEEVLLRLFAMSLVAFILHKIFGKKEEKPSVTVLVVANIVAATLFAVGHLPTNFALFGSSFLIVFRCLLLNGVFGLAFGWLYRQYGLRYAMIAHGGCHIVSKLIWILFI